MPATWRAEMKAMFWGVAGFVTVGLTYLIVIGAMHR